MNREDLIKKWLDHNLNAEEKNAFEALDDHADIVKLTESLKGFKAPDYNTIEEFENIKTKLNTQKTTSIIKPLLRLAAVLLIGFSVFYFTSNLDTNITTTIAQQTTIDLPDASTVKLNASSKLSYNKNKWETNREVYLEGEAFFRVAKGSTFDVKTKHGLVQVLGTEFNVKQYDNFFEVTCFEGLVAVTYNNESLNLKPGNRFKVIDNKVITSETEAATKPSWTASESSFESVPLKYVIDELQRQYPITIDNNSINTEQLFTGSFTHNDLDLALKSITLPLNITYSKNDTVIILKRE